MSKKLNNIILVAWALLVIFNFILLLYLGQSRSQLILTGFVFGFFLHMFLIYPLLNSYEDYNNYTKKMIQNLLVRRSKTRRKTNSISIKRTKKLNRRKS